MPRVVGLQNPDAPQRPLDLSFPIQEPSLYRRPRGVEDRHLQIVGPILRLSPIRDSVSRYRLGSWIRPHGANRAGVVVFEIEGTNGRMTKSSYNLSPRAGERKVEDLTLEELSAAAEALRAAHVDVSDEKWTPEQRERVRQILVRLRLA